MAKHNRQPNVQMPSLPTNPEAFVESLNLGERVAWLQQRQISDLQILNALLNPNDRELRTFTHDHACGLMV